MGVLGLLVAALSLSNRLPVIDERMLSRETARCVCEGSRNRLGAGSTSKSNMASYRSAESARTIASRNGILRMPNFRRGIVL